jgi:hypothetical protein
MNLLEEIRIEPGDACSPPKLAAHEVSIKRKPRFIRGPIPAKWVEQAARLPGKSLQVAVMIRYLDGFEETGMVKLRPSVRNTYGMDRFSLNRALKSLEGAGLILVRRKCGSSPIVTIMEGPSHWKEDIERNKSLS